MVNIFYNKRNLNDTLVVSISTSQHNKHQINDKFSLFWNNEELMGLNIFNFSQYINNLEEGYLYATKEIIEAIKKACNIDLTSYVEKNFVVAKIEKMQKVEKTHLDYCDVSIGERTLKVICGAENAKENELVVLAMIGTKMPNGFSIVKNKIQGFESYGMLCSAKELNIEYENQTKGIILLDKTKYQIGDLFKNVFNNSSKING